MNFAPRPCGNYAGCDGFSGRCSRPRSSVRPAPGISGTMTPNRDPSGRGSASEPGSQYERRERRGQPAGARRSLGNSVLRTLTSFEYRNSIRDLLGKASADKAVLEPDVQLNGLTAIGSSSLAVSARRPSCTNRNATDLADLVLSDTTARKNLVGCDPAASGSSTPSLAISEKVVAPTPELAGARAIQDARRCSHGKLDDPWEGVRYALHALLQSPNFLYRAELGTPEAGGSGRLVLNDYEMASRLSYFLLGTTPDARAPDRRRSGHPFGEPRKPKSPDCWPCQARPPPFKICSASTLGSRGSTPPPNLAVCFPRSPIR